MKYKAALIDLDGTLLRNRTSISEKNLKGLKAFSDLGGDIIIVTGRWPISAFVFNETIEKYIQKKNKYLVSLNGSLIYSLDNKEQPIFEKFIDSNDFNELIKEAYKFGIPFWIYSKEGIANSIIHTYKIPMKSIISKFNFGKIVNYKNDKLNVYKILFLNISAKKLKKFYNNLISVFKDSLQITMTTSRGIEVTAFGVDKGAALSYIALKENMSTKEIVVFGDSGNDIPMFKLAGLKISLSQKNNLLSNLSNVILKHSNGVENGIVNYVLKDINFQKNKTLILDFSNIDFYKIQQTNFIKNIHFWEFLKQSQPLIIISKYSLNNNLIMFDEILKLNNNAIIFSSNYASIYNCKTKKIINKYYLNSSQMTMLNDFLFNCLENPKASIILHQICGANIFLTKNPENYVNHIKNTNFKDENFIIDDKNFDKYIYNKNNKYTNISIYGLDTLPNDLNVNTLSIDVKGNIINIASKDSFIDESKTYYKKHFNSDYYEYFKIDESVNKNKLFDNIDNIIKKQFI